MRFKEFYLTEASQEYNIAKIVAEKLFKLMKHIESGLDNDKNYLKKYKVSNSGMYHIPLKDFINKLNVLENSTIGKMKDGMLYLEFGHIDDKQHPFLYAISRDENGRTQRNKAAAYFDGGKDFLGVHIPFIDSKTGEPFKYFGTYWEGLLIHELTHYVQDIKEKFKKGTSQLSSDEWYANKKEQEAYLHELYLKFQRWLSNEIKELKEIRNDKNLFKYYTKKYNKLVSMFSSLENFEKKWPIDALDDSKSRNRINYIAGNLKDVYTKFLSDTYHELKKEFKNTLPTKEIKVEQK